MKKLILLVLIGFFGLELSFAQEEEPPTPLNLAPVAVQSLFNEAVRNEQYSDALRFGRWLVTYRPKEMEDFPGTYRGDRNFRRMIQAYEGIAGKQSDPSLREAYVDSALIMYDRALSIFTEEEIDHYQWKFNRARFIQSNMRSIDDGRIMTMQEYRNLLELDAERFVESGDGYFIKYLVSEKVANGYRDEAIAIMNNTQPIVSSDVVSHFNEVRSELFRSPEERIDFILTQMDDANEEERMDFYTELFELYGRKGNREKQEEMAQTLYEKNPDYENVMRMAEYAANRANNREAIRFFREAIDLAGNDNERSRINHQISRTYYQMGELQEARRFARRAIQQDSNWGDPLITMAEIYAQAVNECSSGGLDRTDKVVYWLVVDYLERARRVDNSVASRVQRSIPSYQGITPTAEEKFYMNWEDGEEIKVGSNLGSCYEWISEVTTVR